MPTLAERTLYLRPEFAHLGSSEVLRAPVSALRDVGDTQATALASLGIATVFDLGASWVFGNARAAVEAANRTDAATALSSVVDDPFVAIDDVGGLPLASLKGVSTALGEALGATLGTSSIRAFAFWPPRLIAERLVAESLGSALDADEEQTEKLRPRFGEFPTERVYYSRLSMLHLPPNDRLVDLDGPISLAPLASGNGGFDRIAIGAYVTVTQSWYAQGITLGQLLHCMALAPGESTRVAVIDWSRRQRASETETIAEAEELDNETFHGRSVSEVQRAVAGEFQAGESLTSGWARSASSSSQSSASSGWLASLFAGGSSSSTDQNASTVGETTSSSWTLGNREVAARLAQRTNDRTEQHASAVRSRRASVVREVSQDEHERVSTRVVANYNHMHALTVQYYEVVQIYRTEAQLQQAERCLFVPMEIIDFSGARGYELVERFRGALLRAALTARARELLEDDLSAAAVQPVAPVRIPFTPIERTASVLVEAWADVVKGIRQPPNEVRPNEPVAARIADALSVRALSTTVTTGLRVPTLLWNYDEIVRANRFAGRSLLRTDSNALHFAKDVQVVAISVEGLEVKSLHVDRAGLDATQTLTLDENGAVALTPPIAIAEIEAIQIAKRNEAASRGRLVLHLATAGHRFRAPSIPIELGAGTSPTRVVTVNSDPADRRRELVAHLQENREHYSRAIFRSLDSAAIVQLLSRYRWNGRPLAEQVEPRPLTISGNYLVFRAPVDGTDPSGVTEDGRALSWTDLLARRGFDFEGSNVRLIPIPTGGVFAEAVLGRSNSAEHLDITRFWNWQDSPIPLTATEIAPIVTGTRATPEDVRPGQLSAPVVNLVNPTTLPDPTGLGPILTTLANGSIFRDQSGLAGNQQLAGAAIGGTLTAATEAGQLASANLRTEAQKAVAFGQITADLAKSLLGGGGGKSSTQGISGEGARINQGRKLDRQIGASPSATRNPTSTTSTPSRPSSGAGGTPITPSASNASYSREAAYSDAGAYGYSPDIVRSTVYSNDSASTATPASSVEPTDPEVPPAASGSASPMESELASRLDALIEAGADRAELANALQDTVPTEATAMPLSGAVTFEPAPDDNEETPLRLV